MQRNGHKPVDLKIMMRWLAFALVLAVTLPVLSCGGKDGSLDELKPAGEEPKGAQPASTQVLSELLSDVSSLSLETSQSKGLMLTARYSDNHEESVSLSSLDVSVNPPGIIKIENNQVVALAAGEASLVITHKLTGVSVTLPVVVSASTTTTPVSSPVPEVITELFSDISDVTMQVDQIQSLKLSALYGGQNKSSIALSDLDVQLSQNGIVKIENNQIVALAPGEVTLTLSSKDSEAELSLSVIVQAVAHPEPTPTVGSIAVLSQFLLLKEGESAPLSVNATYSDSTTGSVDVADLVVSFSASGVAHWNSGAVVADKAGQVNMTLTHTASGKTTTVTVTVEAVVIPPADPGTGGTDPAPGTGGLDCSDGYAVVDGQVNQLAQTVFTGLIPGDVYTFTVSGPLSAGSLLSAGPVADRLAYRTVDNEYWCINTLPVDANSMACSIRAKGSELYVNVTHNNMCVDHVPGSVSVGAIQSGGLVSVHNEPLTLNLPIESSARAIDIDFESTYVLQFSQETLCGVLAYQNKTLKISLTNLAADIGLLVTAPGTASRCFADYRDATGSVSCNLGGGPYSRLEISVKADSWLHRDAITRGGVSYIIEVQDTTPPPAACK